MRFLHGLFVRLVTIVFFLCAGLRVFATDGEVAFRVIKTDMAGTNLLNNSAWRSYEKGFERDGNVFRCDNGTDEKVKRGVSQHIELNQSVPLPIIAAAWSKAENVGGSRDSNYSVYMDLVYSDGTSLWGQVAQFDTDTHDWQRRQVMIFPEKPVKSLSFYMLLRGHSGKVFFRDPELKVLAVPNGSGMFDSVPIAVESGHKGKEEFLLRDVIAGSDYVGVKKAALGVRLDVKREKRNGARFIDVTLNDDSGQDRALTLIYCVPVDPVGTQWLEDQRRCSPVQPLRQYMKTAPFHVGTSEKMSVWPFGAVANGGDGEALGIDMAYPAFYRAGYSSAAGRLFLAWDVALTREKPSARIRFCRYDFDSKWGFRSALARYYELFPEAFLRRTPEQGIWMPFGKISKVEGWEDFGFKFKEGNDETAWDDAHNIITFRYTEPMTWWMAMPRDMARTLEAAQAEVKRRAEKGEKSAQALLSSGYHDEQGRFAARLLDTPWCNGAVWSMNSMPGVSGDVTDFKTKWNGDLKKKLYGPEKKGDLDGEYIDSSEGYVTDELDFRRDHFAGCDTPLTFAPGSFKPAIFRGLITFEYVRGIERDIHGMGKLMMANATPIRLCWLAPLLDVMGTETDWNHGDKWRPMGDAEMLYRRALCKGKPYCFLMNTDFEKFPHEYVEKFMKRSLAYGMFPGFFSADASTKTYFSQPALYNRDRSLFKKYIPLCRKVAEAVWEPVTLAGSGDDKIYVERFGSNLLTVFNDSDKPTTTTITLDGLKASSAKDLVSGVVYQIEKGRFDVKLSSEDVALLELVK